MPRLALGLAAALAASSCNLVNGPNKNGECRANLLTIAAQEAAFFSEHQRYSTHPVELGFAPSRGNRYLYLLDHDGPVSRRDAQPSPAPTESVGVGPDTKERAVTVEWLRPRFPAEVLALLGVHGACPSCAHVAGCVGNLDEDDDVDVWTISTEDRTVAGQLVNRGTPLHHLDDRGPPQIR